MHRTKHKLKHKAKHKLKHALKLNSDKKKDKELVSKHDKHHHHHHHHRMIARKNGTRHDKTSSKSHEVKIKGKTIHAHNTTAYVKKGIK